MCKAYNFMELEISEMSQVITDNFLHFNFNNIFLLRYDVKHLQWNFDDMNKTEVLPNTDFS